jgi:hypothetical protein
MDAFDAIVQPCKHDPRFREFDFWIGDWDVRPTGQPPAGPPARNTITLDDNGCVLTEHWSAPSGSTGQSFNIFDRSVGKWRQTWVDNIGGQHDYRGGLENGNMVFIGDTPAPNGQARADSHTPHVLSHQQGFRAAVLGDLDGQRADVANELRLDVRASSW